MKNVLLFLVAFLGIVTASADERRVEVDCHSRDNKITLIGEAVISVGEDKVSAILKLKEPRLGSNVYEFKAVGFLEDAGQGVNAARLFGVVQPSYAYIVNIDLLDDRNHGSYSGFVQISINLNDPLEKLDCIPFDFSRITKY